MTETNSLSVGSEVHDGPVAVGPGPGSFALNSHQEAGAVGSAERENRGEEKQPEAIVINQQAWPIITLPPDSPLSISGSSSPYPFFEQKDIEGGNGCDPNKYPAFVSDDTGLSSKLVTGSNISFSLFSDYREMPSEPHANERILFVPGVGDRVFQKNVLLSKY